MSIEAQKHVHSVLISPVVMTNSATAVANVDCKGAEYATITLGLSSEINTNAVGPLLSVSEADTTDPTNFATIVADRTTEDVTTAKQVVWHVDMRRRKRYLRLSVATANSTNDDMTVGAAAILSRKHTLPAALTNMADVTVVV